MLKLDERQATLLDAVGNTSRLKIFLVLWKSKEELTVYRICRFTGLKRKLVDHHLPKLIESKLVLKRVYGEIPLYTVNRDGNEAKALIEFFKKLKI